MSGKAAPEMTGPPDTRPVEVDGSELAVLVQQAQAELAERVQRAGLARDPYRHLMTALSHALGVFAALVDRLGQAGHQRESPMDAAAVDRIETAAANGAARRVGELAQAHNRQTLLKTSGALALAVVTAACGGFAWGWSAANASVHQTEQQLALAFRDGPGAAAAWANLMRSNDVNLALGTCTGLAVKTIEARRACSMPVWMDPPSLSAPAGK